MIFHQEKQNAFKNRLSVDFALILAGKFFSSMGKNDRKEFLGLLWLVGMERYKCENLGFGSENYVYVKK